MKVILVVDDEPDSREALALVLQLEGWTVETAGSAADAIGCAMRVRPAVVLCDLALGPGGDGCAVARAVRAEPGLAATHLFALSGSDTDEARSRARDAGYAEYFLKPVAAAELLARLAAVSTDAE